MWRQNYGASWRGSRQWPVPLTGNERERERERESNLNWTTYAQQLTCSRLIPLHKKEQKINANTWARHVKYCMLSRCLWHIFYSTVTSESDQLTPKAEALISLPKCIICYLVKILFILLFRPSFLLVKHCHCKRRYIKLCCSCNSNWYRVTNVFCYQSHGCSVSAVVRALDLWSRDPRFDSRPVHCRVA